VDKQIIKSFLPRFIVPIYCIETGTCGRTAVLRILGEYHCTFHSISTNIITIYKWVYQKTSYDTHFLL